MPVEIRKSKTGWGGVVRTNVWRPYAVFLDGKPMRDKRGAIRTFGSRQAAHAAADSFLSRDHPGKES